MTFEKDTPSGGTRIQSVARACQLLLWLADRPDGATAKEIAFASRLTLSTTYHLLNTLVDQGLLEKDLSRRYVLGQNSAVVANAYLRAATVPRNLLAGLRELADLTGETVWLADWDNRNIRVLASVDGTQTSPATSVIGRPYLDGHARAGGKLLLAYARDDVREDYIRRHPLRPRTPTTICDARALEAEFSRIRDRAYAYDEQEFVLGVSCVAAPLIGKRGHIVASIAISAPTDRFNRLRRDFTNAALQVVKGIEDGRFDRTLSTEYEFGPARG